MLFNVGAFVKTLGATLISANMIPSLLTVRINLISPQVSRFFRGGRKPWISLKFSFSDIFNSTGLIFYKVKVTKRSNILRT